MNFEKTNVIWFGCTTNPNTIYMPQLNLKWNPASFRILSVEFTSDLKNITDINISNQIPIMEQLIKNWTNRFLTPIGKITVLKTLVLPKIIHILTSLPQMSTKMIKHIERLFFKFIWNDGPEKIKRQTLYQPKNKGGLAMIDINTFSKSLKITWIRRLNISNTKWKEIAVGLFNGLTCIEHFGSDFTLHLISFCHNQFWRDVFLAYKAFFEKNENYFNNNFDETLFMYNKNFKIDKKVIYSEQLEKHDIYQIKQLKVNNNYMSIEQFKSKYENIRINYLQYHAIIVTAKKQEKLRKRYEENMATNSLWSIIFKNEKGVKFIYQSFIQTNGLPTGIKKWQQNNMEQINWYEAFFNLHKSTNDTRLIWFQYRVLHNILSTNRSVSKYNPLQSERCQLCKIHPEFISHLLFECSITKKIWKELCSIINSKCSHANNLSLSRVQILFGVEENGQKTDQILKLIILIAKQYVYKCKFQDRLPLCNLL